LGAAFLVGVFLAAGAFLALVGVFLALVALVGVAVAAALGAFTFLTVAAFLAAGAFLALGAAFALGAALTILYDALIWASLPSATPFFRAARRRCCVSE
jgi:hypothetical protein